MKKPALRTSRFEKQSFEENKWTKSSKSLGEYIFRRLSLDQSNKDLQKIRPRHIMSKLIVSSTEINNYVNDYLAMLENERFNSLIIKNEKINNKKSHNYNYEMDGVSFE